MPKKINESHKRFITVAESFVDANRVIHRHDVRKVCRDNNLSWPNWLTGNKSYDAGYARYYLPTVDGSFNPANPSASFTTGNTTSNEFNPVSHLVESIIHKDPVTMVSSQDMEDRDPNVPAIRNTYVPPKTEWNKVKTIFNSQKFFTIYNTGLSGCGKTLLFEQLCAHLNRKFYRVNITRDTDENDLLGSFRLTNGTTHFEYGPVVEAMKNGGILLLDEVDLATSKIMCLQPVLEGKPIYLKKTNEWIHPAPGFNVVATANTKGKGDTGRFVGTNVLNEAFLDRFCICIEHPYPDPKMEAEIIKKIYIENGADWKDDAVLIGVLVEWADMIRKTFDNDGEIEEIISTRRLVNIVEHYLMFRSNRASTKTNIENSIKDCISRFNETDRDAFISIFRALEKNFDTINVDGTQDTQNGGDTTAKTDASSTSDAVTTSYAAPF